MTILSFIIISIYNCSEEAKIRSNQLFWKKWYALTIRGAWVVRDRKKVGNPSARAFSDNLRKLRNIKFFRDRRRCYWELVSSRRRMFVRDLLPWAIVKT